MPQLLLSSLLQKCEGLSGCAVGRPRCWQDDCGGQKGWHVVSLNANFFERVPESPQQFVLLLLCRSGPPASGGGGNLEVGERCGVSSRGELVQLVKPARSVRKRTALRTLLVYYYMSPPGPSIRHCREERLPPSRRRLRARPGWVVLVGGAEGARPEHQPPGMEFAS